MLKAIIIRCIDFILFPLYGKKQFQSLFGLLHSISLKGMNLRYSAIGDNGESWLIKNICNYYKKKQIMPLIFDIGANQGLYSLALLSTSNSQIKLYSFEPSLKTFALLQKNIPKISSSVTLCNFGFSNENAKLRLYYNADDPATNSLFSMNLIQNNIFEEVEMRRIDDFCQMNCINHIQFIKIDVEGNEINVLRGAKCLLELNSIDFIQFEFGPRNVDSRTYLKDFYSILEDKYSIYRILKNGLYSLNPYHQDYEAFFAGNYLAICKNISVSALING